MNIQVQNHGFSPDSKLLALIAEKINKLNGFHDQVISVAVFMKLDNVGHEIKDKITKINVYTPKKTFFKESTSKLSFEVCFRNAYDSIVNQIKKKKEKQIKTKRQLAA